MQTVLAITKALADPSRLRILCALSSGREICACQFYDLLELAPSTVSRHLAILTQAGLVESRKDGKWVHFRLTEEPSPAAVEALAWVARHCSCQTLVEQDSRRLAALLNTEPEELCQLQALEQGCCSSAPETRAGVKWQRVGHAR